MKLFGLVSVSPTTSEEELTAEVLRVASLAYETGGGACTLAYRPSMVAKMVEMSSEGDVAAAHRELLSGHYGVLNLGKLLSLSWGVAALIVCNETYSLSEVEAIWGLVPGMGCLTGTGFALKEPAQDLAMALMSLPGMTAPVDWITWTPAGPGCRKSMLRLNLCGPARPTDDTCLTYQQAARRSELEQEVLEALQALTLELSSQWPADIPLGCELRAHYVQWQLCEYAGYEDVRMWMLGRGSVPTHRRLYPRAVREMPDHLCPHCCQPRQ